MKTAGQNTLDFTRYYNSRGNALAELGANWRPSYNRFIWFYSSSSVGVQRADDQTLIFTLNGTTWIPDSDVAYTLTNPSSTWTLTTPNDTVEIYITSAAINAAVLNIIQARNGYTQTLTYNASNQQLASVTDSYGRRLTFTYNASGLLQTLGTPDARTFTYGYTATTSAQNLTSVTYPTTTPTSNIYVYENPNLTNTLTGVIDETGNRYATWTYDAYGRALTSSLGGSLNANLTTVAYNDTDGSRTVTNALGATDTYTVATLQGVPKVARISRAATATTAAATRAFTYDANGFIASSTDWDGNVTTYTHDSRGDETSRVEASGTALARTIGTTWLSAFHLPARITEPNRSPAFSYDACGNLLTKRITAGTATRGFAYSYNAFGQVLTAADPRGNVTNYAYDAKGNRTSVSDALGHVTSTPSYDANGRPLTTIDPNGVTTSLTYDPRGRLTSRTAGTLKTAYAYDKAGNLIQVTQPDGSYLVYTYDPAHRLTGIADAAGDHIAYALDAAGNRIKEQAFDPSGMLSRTRSYAYDALNRLSQTIGAQSQTTAYAYDKQGNLTTVTDPLSDAANYNYDALNRLSHGIDPNGGITSYRYDANDHLTGVLDPRNLLTAYAWDGLDDELQLASPDTGQPAQNFSYDALGRLTIYASSAATQTNTYDANGNRASYLDNAAPPVSLSYNIDPASNRLAGIGGSWAGSFTYDATDNMLSYSTPLSGYSFAYDARNRQTQSYVGAIGTSWLINGLGQRVAQINLKVPEFFFVYDEAGHLTGKYGGGGNPIWETVWLGDLPVAALSPAGNSISRRIILARRI